MTFKSLLLSASAVGASIFGFAGLSTSALAADAAAASSATTIEELVVTAEKREQNLQTVAASVSAFNSKQRDLLGLATIQDLTNFTPGLSYNTGLDRLAIRGIGRNTNNLTADPGVATYVDGVYSAQSFTAGGSPLFVDRIEVLRGPEGTLYGRNSIGGAINAISKRPSKDFNAEIRAGIANYKHSEIGATVTGPLNDRLQYRLNAAYASQTEGYFHSIDGLDDEGGVTNAWYLELQLQAQITDKITGWLKVSDRYFNNSNRSNAYVGPYDTAAEPTGTSGPGGNFAFCNLAGATTPCPTYAPNTVFPSPTLAGQAVRPTNVVMRPGGTAANPAASDIRSFQGLQNAHTHDRDNIAVAAELNWDLDFATLKYIGGYQHYALDIFSGFQNTAVLSYDYPCGPTCTPIHASMDVPNYYLENKTFYSHELNLSSAGTGPVQWIAGLYSYREHYYQPVDFDIPGDTFLALVQLPRPQGPSGPVRSIDYYNTEAEGTSAAAFGQVDWKVTDTIKLTGGVRYTKDHKGGVESTRQLYAFMPPLGNSFTGNGLPAGTLGYVNQPAPLVLNLTPCSTAANCPAVTKGVSKGVYDAATGIGYREYNDSWNATTGTAGVEWTPKADTLIYGKYSRGYKSGGFNTGFISANAETKPEYVNAYEVGYKASLLSNLQANLAAYYYDYINDQIPISVSQLNQPAQTQFFNIPKVKATGFEAEVIWIPIDNLTLNMAYDYAEATIKDGGGCFVDGNDQKALQPGVNTTGCVAGGPQNVTGASLAQTPKNKVSINALYRIDLQAGYLTLSGNYVWKDETYSSIFNRYYNLAPSYSQVDLRALYADKDNRYTVIGFVKNAFDKLGYDSATGFLLTSGQVGRVYGLTAPRTYGIELQYRFQ